ncbi:MAG: glycosyltransferase family 4 protein [Rhodospirillales bacterium]|nr:glycosyltransferase family 4 protein [Rhodospirillales bacterium]
MARLLLPLCTAIQDAGHEVVAICSDGPLLEHVRQAGVRCRPVPIARSMNPLKALRSSEAVSRVLREERFDLVHVHTPVASLVGRLAAWRTAVPTLAYTAHGFYFHEHMPRFRRNAFVVAEWIAGRVTDVLMTQSREDAAFARKHGLIAGPVIEAIGNGVDAARFTPGPAERRASVRDTLQTPQDAPVVMMVGRLVAEKGYPELFGAMGSVDAHLWVAGARLASDHADPIDLALAELDADPALKRRVHLLGEREDVPDLLAAADLFTLPSRREGMPRSIIEAMMTGLPVVATDIRGSREEVVPGETGHLVPVGDIPALAAALDDLIRDPLKRTAFGAAGRRRALELYDETKVIARQLGILGLT